MAGTGRQVRIEGKMIRAMYREILDENMLRTSDLGEGSPFQQENDPKHTAESMQECLRDNSVNVLQWPSQT